VYTRRFYKYFYDKGFYCDVNNHYHQNGVTHFAFSVGSLKLVKTKNDMTRVKQERNFASVLAVTLVFERIDIAFKNKSVKNRNPKRI